MAVALRDPRASGTLVHLAPSPRRRRRPLFWIGAAMIAACFSVTALAWAVAPRTSDLPVLVQSRLAAEGSLPVSLSSVSPWLRQAVVAAEDERFFRHSGIDSIGLLRAAAYDASHFSAAQGASTITEQLAKILYLGGNDRSPWRKLEDMVLAVRIEQGYSKEQILGAYLNSAYFGEGAYGIGAASQRFFGVAPSKLTLAQASLLAGVIQDPSGYDPFVHPVDAGERRAAVLRSMIRNGFITTDEARRVLSSPLPLAGGGTLLPALGASLAPAPLFSGLQLSAGLALLAFGTIALFEMRRRRKAGAFRLVPLGVVAAGALLVARSLRVA